MTYPTLTNQDFEAQEHPLKPGIRAAFAALSADYGEAFLKQFRQIDGDERPLTPTRWKYRLLQLTDTMSDMPDIVTAAVNSIASRCGGCPTILEIVAECRTIRAARYDAAETRREIESRAALPPPSRVAKPGEIHAMIAKAFDGKKDGNIQELLQRKREALQRHELLLKADALAGRIRQRNNEARCSFGGCSKHASVSHGTKGDGEFYCTEHFRMAG